MSQGLGDINKKLGSLEDKLKSAQNSSDKLTSSLDKGLKGIAGYFAFNNIKSFGENLVYTTARFQTLSSAIKFASDSSVQGEISMNWISNLSSKYGLPLEATAEGFKTLQGAMIGTKFSSGEVRKMFEQVSTGAVAMGLDAENTKGVFLALGQIMGKGKVQAEELRGQIGERVPGAFSIAARAMGMTTAQLDKFMSDGKLIAEDFLPKFAAEMEKTFGEGAALNSDGLSQNISRLTNSWNEFLLALGGSGSIFSSVFGQLSKGLDSVSESLRSVQDNAKRSINTDLVRRLDESENNIKSRIESQRKKGISKDKISQDFEKERQFYKMYYDEQLAASEGKLEELRKFYGYSKEGKQGMFGQRQTAEELDDLFSRTAPKKDQALFKKLTEDIELSRALIAGTGSIYDKQISNLYKPSSTATGKGKLGDELKSVSGQKPSVTNINIEALIKNGTNNNYMGSPSTVSNDLNSYLGQLNDALLTVVNDINIVDR